MFEIYPQVANGISLHVRRQTHQPTPGARIASGGLSVAPPYFGTMDCTTAD